MEEKMKCLENAVRDTILDSSRDDLREVMKKINPPEAPLEAEVIRLLLDTLFHSSGSMFYIFMIAEMHLNMGRLIENTEITSRKDMFHLIETLLHFTDKDRQENPELWNKLSGKLYSNLFSFGSQGFMLAILRADTFNDENLWRSQLEVWKIVEPMASYFIYQYSSVDSSICSHACESGNRLLVQYIFGKYNPNGFYRDKSNSRFEYSVLYSLTRVGAWTRNNVLSEKGRAYVEFVFSMSSFDPSDVWEKIEEKKMEGKRNNSIIFVDHTDIRMQNLGSLFSKINIRK